MPFFDDGKMISLFYEFTFMNAVQFIMTNFA